MRREVGPVAWCALEVLVERAEADRTAQASARAVAVELGVAKNTAHRALVVLARGGLVEAMQDRGAGGRFQPGRYRLRVDHLLASTTRRRNARHQTPTPSDQLTLLPPP